MNILIDIVLPPIIVALLISMIFGVNSLILSSSVENRLMYELQGFANNSLLIIQEELRTLKEVEELTGSSIRFVAVNNDTIGIGRDGRNLIITKTYFNGTPSDTVDYPARLADLSFSPGLSELLASSVLFVQISTESLSEQEVGDRELRFTGVAEKEIYLRTLHLTNQ